MMVPYVKGLNKRSLHKYTCAFALLGCGLLAGDNDFAKAMCFDGKAWQKANYLEGAGWLCRCVEGRVICCWSGSLRLEADCSVSSWLATG